MTNEPKKLSFSRGMVVCHPKRCGVSPLIHVSWACHYCSATQTPRAHCWLTAQPYGALVVRLRCTKRLLLHPLGAVATVGGTLGERGVHPLPPVKGTGQASCFAGSD